MKICDTLPTSGSVRSYRSRLRTASAWMVPVAVGFLCLSTASFADDLVYASGQILSKEGRPMSGALVGIYDDQNKIVDYARTDKNGYYAVAVPKTVVHINHRSGKGFIAEVVGGVAQFVGGAAAFVANPVRAGVSTVTGSEVSAFTDPLTRGEIAAGGAVVDKVLFAMTPPRPREKLVEERKNPGNLVMKVSMPGSNDLVGLGRIYWLQQTVFTAGGKQNKMLQAWLDPVELTPNDSSTPSAVNSKYLRFTSARLEPSLAQAGDHVRIVAHLPVPLTPEVHVVVVARNSRTGQKWELMPVGNGRYEGEMQIDSHFPQNDQVIGILAYAAESDRLGRRKDAESAIEGAGLWDPKKPYRYDPTLVVSRTRADVTLTVLPPPTRHH